MRSNSFFKSFLAALAVVTMFLAGTPVFAQSMNTNQTCAGTCPMPPSPPSNSQFTVGFQGSSWSAAVNTSSANRGSLPIVGRVVSEFAEAGSRTNDANSIGVDIRVTSFQPGSTCELTDCNATRAIVVGNGLSTAEGFSTHSIRTEGQNGGPASASSSATSAGQTGFGAQGIVNWNPIGVRHPPLPIDVARTPAAAPTRTN